MNPGRSIAVILSVAVALGAGAPAVGTAAQAPAPADAPTRAAQTGPRTATPPVTLTPVRPARDDFRWMRSDLAPLINGGSWSTLARENLGRDATRADLDRVLSLLGARPAPNADPAAPVSVWAARLAVVRALGLEAERRALQSLSTADGTRLRVPRNFASEVLARELGLVPNHPAHLDRLERARREPMRLADLAYMAARARDLSPWTLDRMSAYRELRLPVMTSGRRAVVEAALAQVGRPYVWGGDWPGPRSPWGAQAVGGFDCSGLVWWAFKGAAGSRQMGAGDGLLGRTADDMAFERPRQRIATGDARPGDLVFFGPAGPRSRRGTISHMAIALGDGWIVHSAGSRGGPSVGHLDAYWPSATAFARRIPVLG
jgi:hypothetical protein